jgi:hypothetical protein
LDRGKLVEFAFILLVTLEPPDRLRALPMWKMP